MLIIVFGNKNKRMKIQFVFVMCIRYIKTYVKKPVSQLDFMEIRTKCLSTEE